jgi:hypothetical protein
MNDHSAVMPSWMPEDSESLCLVGKADESRLACITVSEMIQLSWSGSC